MSEEEKKAIELLDKFITEHKLFNIKQADNLEDNIQILLDLIEKQSKVIDEMAEKIYKLKIKLELNDLLEDCFIPREFSDIDNCIKTDCKECIKHYFYRKVEEDNE